jgi:hypothetical protein
MLYPSPTIPDPAYQHVHKKHRRCCRHRKPRDHSHCFTSLLNLLQITLAPNVLTNTITQTNTVISTNISTIVSSFNKGFQGSRYFGRNGYISGNSDGTQAARRTDCAATLGCTLFQFGTGYCTLLSGPHQDDFRFRRPVSRRLLSSVRMCSIIIERGEEHSYKEGVMHEVEEEFVHISCIVLYIAS